MSGKPDPVVVVRALRSLDVSPIGAVYVSDREVDCEASQRAYMNFVLVNRDSRLFTTSCEPIVALKSLLKLPVLISKL